MFKKSLMAVFAIFASSAAFGAPAYNGYLASAPIGARGDVAVADVTFNCKDDNYGHFDMCVDVSFTMARPDAKVKMGVNLSSKVMRSHKNVLVRYNFTRSENAQGGPTDWYVQVLNDRGRDFVMPRIFTDRVAVVTRVSNNGGANWSNLKLAYK